MKKIILSLFLVSFAAIGCTKVVQNSQSTPTNTQPQSYINNTDKYSFDFPGNYELRSFDDFGTDVAASTTSTSIGVRKTADPSNNFVFLVREDSNISKLSESAVKEQVAKNPNPSDYTVTSVLISGTQAYKVTYTGSDKGVVSDFYYIQNPNQQGAKVLDLTVVKNDSTAQQVLNTFKLQ